MIKKCTIQSVLNGYKLLVEFDESCEKHEFVDSTMEGILLILYNLQAAIRESTQNPSKKGSKK